MCWPFPSPSPLDWAFVHGSFPLRRGLRRVDGIAAAGVIDVLPLGRIIILFARQIVWVSALHAGGITSSIYSTIPSFAAFAVELGGTLFHINIFSSLTAGLYFLGCPWACTRAFTDATESIAELYQPDSDARLYV